jgi:hypothetical protein
VGFGGAVVTNAIFRPADIKSFLPTFTKEFLDMLTVLYDEHDYWSQKHRKRPPQEKVNRALLYVGLFSGVVLFLCNWNFG